MKIGVFELGLVPEQLASAYPGYAHMIIDWLRPHLPGVEFIPIATARSGDIPAAPGLDGYIYSGSRYGVYDDVPWIAPLEAFIREAAGLGRPQFGICFGHQLIAQAMGGRVEKSTLGWGCGIQRYTLSESSGDDTAKREFSVLVMHQDQVREAAPQAQVLGGSAFCPLGIIDYASPIRTVQFHPEFDAGFVAALLDIMGGEAIPAEVATRALASLPAPVDADAVAVWAAAFFRSNGVD